MMRPPHTARCPFDRNCPVPQGHTVHFCTICKPSSTQPRKSVEEKPTEAPGAGEEPAPN